jgi:hypothetical protein
MNFAKTALLALALAAGAAKADLVTTNIYSGFNAAGDGSPFTGLVGTLNTPGITFGTDTGFNWHPFGLGSYGAQSLARFEVQADGNYTFSLVSDDGSAAYIDGVLAVDDGGPHGPALVSNTVHLTAGVHSLTINFFEDFGGNAGVDFRLADGAHYVQQVPEPFSLALVAAGLAGLSLARRRKA